MKTWLGAALAAFGLTVGGPVHRDHVRHGGIAVSEYAPAAVGHPVAPACNGDASQILAALAEKAYGDEPSTCRPEGFLPARLAEVSLSEGRYASGPVAALAVTGALDGAPVLVVAFRGSDDPAVWLADLRNINAPYGEFGPLVHAIERYAAAGGQVVITGHSAGGTMAQLFMYAHPGDDHYRAVTFGSPGALPEPGVFAARDDPRITNYSVSDDPFVFLGEHRAEVASHGCRDWGYAVVLAAAIAHESGLSMGQVLGSEPYLHANYVNNGAKVMLPSGRPDLTVGTAIRANMDEHEVATYVARIDGEAPS